MTGRSWTPRPLSHSDEPRILKLFETVFGRPLAPERWRWQFPGNPFCKPIVWVAKTARDGIVGHYALVPVPFWRAGKVELAAFSIHSMIHPSHQRQGILKALAASAERQLEDHGIRTLLTFLNDNSLPVYTRSLGWQELPAPPIHFFILDSAGVLGRYLPLQGLRRAASLLTAPATRLLFPRRRQDENSHVRVGPIKRFDERADQLWQKVRRTVSLATDRSSAYLNWRLAENPVPYTIQAAEAGDRLLGYVATRCEERFGMRLGYIVDLLFDDAHQDVAGLLLAKSLESLRSQNCAMAIALSGKGGPLREALREGGFRRLPPWLMPHGMHFCLKDRTGTLQAGPPSGLQWFLSWSDHDVV